MHKIHEHKSNQSLCFYFKTYIFFILLLHMLIKKQILNFHINYNNFYSKISTVLNHICVTDQNTQILIASGTFLIYFIFKESINYLLEIFRLISLQACANTGNQWDLTKNTRKNKTKNQESKTKHSLYQRMFCV